MKTDNIRFIDAVVAFDEISNANLYHVQVIHPFDSANDAISAFSRSVKLISDHWTISNLGDTCARFVVVSSFPPSLFEKILTNFFDVYKPSYLFSLIF